VIAYSINSIQNSMMKGMTRALHPSTKTVPDNTMIGDEWKNDPRNPYAKSSR